jgi:hypothetical protein
VTSGTSPRRAFAGFLIGMILMQTAWILTMPAFRGSDEFDHVYQAAAVARGQWSTHEAAPHGRGGIVTIPESIVRAASRVCQYYDYVGHDNCFPIKTDGKGQAEVATAAGVYNPAYYLIIGTAARPFGGSGADFVMRAVSAFMCALLIASAAAVTARWASSTWPLVTFAVGLTPVLVYSTAMTAPNGVTYASATLVWASLIGLVRSRNQDDDRGLAIPLTVGAIALVATHTSGALWLALSGAVVITLRPLSEWADLVKRRWRTWSIATVVILLGTLLCVAWIRLEHTNQLGTKVLEDDPFPWARLPVYQILWALQAIGAFPLRGQPAPVPVYAIWGPLLLTALLALFRLGGRRIRLAGTATLVLLMVVPTILTVMSYRTESIAWQGRYALPLWLGITFLAGLALDQRVPSPSAANARVVFTLLAAAMTISTVHVGLREISTGPADPAAAFPGGMLLVGLLTLLGALAPLRAVVDAHAKRPKTAEQAQQTSRAQ